MIAGDEKCQITQIPHNGFAQLSGSSKRITVNDSLDNYDQIEYKCNDNHFLVGDAGNLCINGKWMRPLPECQPRCNPAEISTTLSFADCYRTFNEETVNVGCTEPAEPGTVARIFCRYSYHVAGGTVWAQEQQTTCADDGQWLPKPKSCVRTNEDN